ncbi:MAG TPA: DNA topoisomerase 4 subunit A [Clostridia bacterium]|nr:DNA topoisomerase 4 subunit A [Clostridia bacterium]
MCAKKKIAAVEEIIEEKIQEYPLEKAVHSYMMPYAEYIILERALPRVEDGLKPVQRRILYTMHELNLKPEGPYKKSARVVGDCLGKYHPHGDASIYMAMVNMAQDFNMRNTLVKGHGNFGTLEDPPAAMRYTEVKLEPLACELLRDLEKETVKWVKNFDDTMDEPDVLPGRFPNLLVNGCMGIAIGLATKIPPHNLEEVIDGTIALIEKPGMTVKEMLCYIKGPDFPTGGFIIPDDTLESIYTTGKGKLILRARVEIENNENDRQSIVITEFPYNVNKAELQIKIRDMRESMCAKKGAAEKAEMVLNGIQEIVDESDRNGTRVVIKLKKGEDAAKLLEFLYKKTDLQCNFNVNMMAIADGRPQQLGLIPLLKYYIEFQRDVIYKRSAFDLCNAKKREHILDGFVIIFPNIDEVVALIKASGSRSEARDNLRERFSLSERQADAILDLKLVNLTRLEITKIEKELKELKVLIAKLEEIVNSKRKQLEVVKEELTDIKNRYKSKRLSIIVNSLEDIEVKPFEVTQSGGKRGYLIINSDGKVKFVTPRIYLSADRTVPKGKQETSKHIQYLDKCEQAIIFGSLGNAYRFNPDIIMENNWKDEGYNLCDLVKEAPIEEKAVFSITINADNKDKDMFFFTKEGMVKRSVLSEYDVCKDFFQVCVLKEGDEIINAELIREDAGIVFVTSDGMCINTEITEFPSQGRRASGVIGVSLNDGEQVVFAGFNDLEYGEAIGELVLITDGGYAKRVIMCSVEMGKRARKGVKVMDTCGSKLIFASPVTLTYDVALIGKNGSVATVNTEDILIDRNRLSKGKPLPMSLGCVDAIKHISDIIAR